MQFCNQLESYSYSKTAVHQHTSKATGERFSNLLPLARGQSGQSEAVPRLSQRLPVGEVFEKRDFLW